MALTGVHIAFGYLIADAGDRPSGTALPFNATASDTMAAAGTSSKAAPTISSRSTSDVVHQRIGTNLLRDWPQP